MNKWITRLFYLSVMLSTLIVSSCHDEKKAEKPAITTRVVTAALQSVVKPLYLTGTLAPIKTISVLSPVDGRIENLHFEYGDAVKKHQLLAVINSLKLMDNFRQAVSGYLEKKASYLIQAQQIQGYRLLYRAGVLAKNDYLDRENAYQTAAVAFFQQQYELKKILAIAKVNPKVIEHLTLRDTKKIRQLFSREFNHIKVYAPDNGVALFPMPDQGNDNNSDSSDGGVLTVGSTLREGQLLLSIGDLSGFSISMLVSEVNVNSLHTGMPAVITGDAFAGIKLHGVITYVASQAQPSGGVGSGSNQNIGQFKVVVQVKHITPAVRSAVLVGMTAKVAVTLDQKKHIVLPLNAVFEKNGKEMVTIVDHNGQKKNVFVMVGASLPEGVVIFSGITPGQKVVVRD